MILVPSLHIRLFLVVVGIGVTIHLKMLKTLGPEEMKVLNDLYASKPKDKDDRAKTT